MSSLQLLDYGSLSFKGKMADSRPIGLFDSGVGGLSVLLEITKVLPGESFVFLADQGHNPYGEKSPKELQDLSLRIAKFLLGFDSKLLVVACNTATCYALDTLRSTFNIPIVGVVPAIKPAASQTKKKKIAIISTPATAKSDYLSQLVADHADNLAVLKLGCDGLEESIEYLKFSKITTLLKKYTGEIKKFGADVVVLGCTHYPFVKEEIRQKLGPKVKIIDSGSAIAARTRSILAARNELAQGPSKDLYFTTGNAKIFSKVASTLLQYNVVAQKVTI